MPRLFTGVELPDDVAADLALKRGGIPGARWIDEESFHITLRFIGDIDETLATEIAYGLAQAAGPAFTLTLRGVDVFGGNKPHTLYAGVEDNAELRRLQAAHERICQMMGAAPDPRRFSPHVTLARLKDAEPMGLSHFVQRHSLYRSRPFRVERFVLFSSRPARGGGPYAVEQAYDLRIA
ncbi:MAG TPA: RNA 2',3'-cyclic phosphodiesterase [Aestuariivirga sp.]|nr:RNA 2',3'-cyclic phosphodiesterase [Aestuariivirga sp.]